MAIITDRLIIKPLTTKDSDFIDKLVNTNEWSEFVGDRKVSSEIEATEYIQKIIDNPHINYWIVRIRENGVPIGIMTFIKRDYMSYYDIGTAFLPFYTNNGYAYEAVKAMLHRVIYSAEQSHIISITRSASDSAIKLLKRLGVEFDREIEVESEKLQVYSFSADKLVIDEIINSSFKVFDNKKNRLPNWDLLRNICVSEIKIINKHGTSHKVYNLDLFIEPRKKLLFDGALGEIEEEEIYEEPKIIASIAQLYTEYDKSAIIEGKPFRQHGYKLFKWSKQKLHGKLVRYYRKKAKSSYEYVNAW